MRIVFILGIFFVFLFGNNINDERFYDLIELIIKVMSPLIFSLVILQIFQYFKGSNNTENYNANISSNANRANISRLNKEVRSTILKKEVENVKEEKQTKKDKDKKYYNKEEDEVRKIDL